MNRPQATDNSIPGKEIPSSDNANALTEPYPPANGGYEWREIEPRWQAAWRDSGAFVTPSLPEGVKGAYIFAACPFTSGGAHIGHIRSYTLADSYARFRRARGDPVLFSIGFDSFGLPAELEAIRNQIHPRQWVDDCYRMMRGQFDAMGFSFDWGRTFITSDEDMYRWSQWLFVTFLERDLVYQKGARVDWCNSCNTVLARSQVEDGNCWRCGNAVRLVSRLQWFFRASPYFVENDERLDDLVGWDKNSLGAQRAVLGRTDGVELKASTVDGRSVPVFISNIDTVSSAAFVVASPRHPELDTWITDESIRRQIEGLRTRGLARSDRKAEQVEVIDTGLQIVVPGLPHTLPLIISPYVDPRFGPTAILGIPQEDTTAQVIADGLRETAPSALRVTNRASAGTPAVRFSAGDFPISRQRAWGAPIPLVHCANCGTVPVPLEDLPVKLPDDLEITGSGNALEEHLGFVQCRCPTCHQPARRETDTLDCHVDGLWMWMPICVPPSDRSREMFTHPEIRRWIPIHLIVWGLDGGAYILSHRTLTKMLRDNSTLDYLPDGEPFMGVLMHGMVQQDGRKMSKHLGNVVDPNELVERVGADTLRLAALYAAAPKNEMNWTEDEVKVCHRFLTRLWQYATSRLDMLRLASNGGKIDKSDQIRSRLAKWCDIATTKVTNDLEELQMHRAVRNLMLMLTRTEDFEQRVLRERGELDDRDREALGVALLLLIQMFAPLTPHIAEELWLAAGNDGFLSSAPWPMERS